MIDLVLLALIGVSALFGLMRGLLATVLGVVNWLLAGAAAFYYGARAALLLADQGQPSAGDYVGGYLLVFIGVLLAATLIGRLLRGVVDATVGTGLDQKATGIVIANDTGGPDRHRRVKMGEIERHIVRRAAALQFARDDLRQRLLFRPVTDQIVVIDQPATAANDSASLPAQFHASDPRATPLR